MKAWSGKVHEPRRELGTPEAQQHYIPACCPKCCRRQQPPHLLIICHDLTKFCYNLWLSVHGTNNLSFTLCIDCVVTRGFTSLYYSEQKLIQRWVDKRLWLAIAFQKSTDMSVTGYIAQRCKNTLYDRLVDCNLPIGHPWFKVYFLYLWLLKNMV